MSNVKFNIPITTDRKRYSSSGHKPDYTATARAAREALGLPEEALQRVMNYGVTIVARLDQFALFLILRHTYGGSNLFACLNPRLVPETTPCNEIDVTSRT